MPFDLEAEQLLLRVIDGVVFYKAILHGRVDAVTCSGESFAVATYVEHIVVECVRTIKVSRLPQPVGLRISEARDILQAMIARKADGFDVRSRLRVGDAVREFFHQ